MFQHYIVTRFNLKPKDGTLGSGASAEWMEERFKIFQNFCYPSVVQQENKKFSWLVFFDSDTDEKYKKIITRLVNESEIFRPVFVNNTDEFIPRLKSEIKSRPESNFVITSRLDNDDCLHKNYVESVQREFNRQDYLAINFINGLTLKISRNIRCGYRIHANNPFISLIESAKTDIETVYCRPHGSWGKIKLTKQINNDQPLWITVVHQNNVLNRYIGFGYVKPEILEDFNIDKSAVKDITGNLKPNSMLTSFINMLIANSHYNLKKIRNVLRKNLNLIPQK